MCIWLFFGAALGWGIWILLDKKMNTVKIRAAVSLNILMLVAFSIYLSIVQPYMSAAMFPVVLVVIGFAYIDRFFDMTIVLALASAAFALTSHKVKPLSIFYVDLYNVIIFFTLAIVLHYSFQHVRIATFVTHYENVDIQRSLDVRSSFDTLTSLLNRGRFFSIATEIMHNTHEDYMVLCLMDLDGFKKINDKLGHQMGDKALQLTAEIIQENLGIEFVDKWSFGEKAAKEKLSFAGRLGGDEFVVLLRGRKTREEIIEEINRLLEALAGVRVGDLEGIYSSVGIVELSAKDKDIDIAYSRADEALNLSKIEGNHSFMFSES
jgi:GGDEF domain-containing protein